MLQHMQFIGFCGPSGPTTAPQVFPTMSCTRQLHWASALDPAPSTSQSVAAARPGTAALEGVEPAGYPGDEGIAGGRRCNMLVMGKWL